MTSSDNDQLPFNDLPEGDPLAPWRPDAPWPEEERALWEQFLKKANGDQQEGLKELQRLIAQSKDGFESLQSLYLKSLAARKVLELRTESEEEIIKSFYDLSISQKNFYGSPMPAPLIKAVALRSATSLGAGHVVTLRSELSLAACLRDLGKFPEAISLIKSVIKRSAEIFGEDDPETLKCVTSLAITLRSAGKAEQALAIFQSVLSKREKTFGKNSRESLNSMSNIVLCYRSLGLHRIALPLAESVVVERKRLLGDHHKDTIKAIASLAITHKALGELRHALSHYKIVLEKRQERLGPDHPETLKAIGNLAACYRALGQARRALPLIEQVVDARKRILGDDHIDTIKSVASLALTCSSVGEKNRAQLLLEEVLAKRTRLLGARHPATLLAMANFAFLMRQQGDYEKAASLYKEVIFYRSSLLGADNYKTLTSKANLAACLRHLGQLEEAKSLVHQVFEKRQEILGGSHPDTLMCLHQLYSCHEALGEKNKASGSLKLLFSRLAAVQDRDRNWLRLVTSASEALSRRSDSGGFINWRSDYRLISIGFLADLDLAEPDEAGHIHAPFRDFHSNWLKLCLANGAAEEIPHVLSAVQGREMAAMLLAELEASEADYPKGDPRKLYLEVVRELRQLRLVLRTTEDGDIEEGSEEGRVEGIQRPDPIDPPKDGDRRARFSFDENENHAEQRRANTDRLRERTAALMEELNRLRSEIAEIDATFALAYRPPDVSVERLAEGMAGDEAKVLLFMHAQEDSAEPVPHACCITAGGKAEVLVLNHLPAAREAMNSAGLRGTARMGMRGPRGAVPRPKLDTEESEGRDDALIEEPQADLASLMSETFWQPLRTKFPQVTKWHLATHQDLHVLPVGLGLDPSHTMTVHPGLLFLARKQDKAINDYAPMRLAMHSDPADGTDVPIPFVEAEAKLARLVWGEDRIALGGGEETLDRLNAADPPLDALLLAAHGDELDTEPPQTIVWLDRAAARILDTTAVLSSSQRPGVVIASACVAGRVREDSLGEPLGLVSAFFLKGARFVLAPLQPIQDLQAPLVFGLFHRAWKETGNPRRAWQVAREQALSGKWPEDYEEQLRAAYAPVMRSMLERAMAKEDYLYSVILRTGWQIEPLDRAGLMAVEDDDQATIDQRMALIDRLVSEGINQVLAEKTKAARGKPSTAIRRICDWTMPFGS